MPKVKVKTKSKGEYAFRVQDVRVEQVQASGDYQIVVDFDILKGDKVANSRSLGFAQGTETKEIESELAKTVQTYVGDLEAGERAKPQEAMTKQVNELRDGLLGKSKGVDV